MDSTQAERKKRGRGEVCGTQSLLARREDEETCR